MYLKSWEWHLITQKGQEMKISKTNDIVKDILVKEPFTRNSDNILYIKVVERLNSNANDKPFSEVMANLKELGLPCYETVSRCRRKLQEQHPELQACDRVQDFRTANEEEFRTYFGKENR